MSNKEPGYVYILTNPSIRKDMSTFIDYAGSNLLNLYIQCNAQRTRDLSLHTKTEELLFISF
jgi:hypothetical protein